MPPINKGIQYPTPLGVVSGGPTSQITNRRVPAGLTFRDLGVPTSDTHFETAGNHRPAPLQAEL